MKKNWFYSVLSVLFVTLMFTSCYRVTPDAGQEAVLVHKPYFFGKDGVDKNPVGTGSKWVWWSTDAIAVSMVPQK